MVKETQNRLVRRACEKQILDCSLIMSATENEKKEYSTLLNNSLRELLDTLGKAHKADILAYSSGHLNHNKLRKLLVRKSNMPQWESSQQKESGPLQKRVSKALVKKMTDAWADFTINTSLITDHPSAESSLFRCPYPQESVKSSITPIGKDRKDNSSRRHRESLKEVEPTDLLLLKPQPVRYDRHNTECTPDQYQITQSYISGLTRTDQFNMLLDFERGILRTQDMQEMESKSGHHVVKRHEEKLVQELKKISSASWPSFTCLQIFRDIFNDICNESHVFGGILTQIKTEYELYLESVLDNQPAVQHQSLQAQVRGMEKKAVITQEVEGARQEVLRQQEIARKALEENEQLRNVLQFELSKPGTLEEEETCKKHMTALDTKEEHTATAAELVQSKRRQIQAVWDEIQELEKDIKDTMVPIVITNTTEKCIRDTKAEVTKIRTFTEYIQQATKDLENGISRLLSRKDVSKEIQENFMSFQGTMGHDQECSHA
ncbi:uncharacterized protein C6orf118-like isoform X2 [Acipenser ruthenus]|uniref:uncharacterized protein C6orf118-like isoform X2 n=1 Tax=Acipenser ruthenus TaxID=7906 RepID=UPI0027422A63|nr:uncharacterized protein C6orf118-like isoform X2 [Acipenser ruthenus]